MTWVIIGVSLFCLPFLVYIVSKAATLGKLQAIQEVSRKYTSIEEMLGRKSKDTNPQENNNGKEKK